MSLAGRPPRNGDAPQEVPPDLVWDENNHPIIFDCSLDTVHTNECRGRCGSGNELTTETQVALLNEARAFARAGMSFMGVPAAYEGVIKLPGIKVELVDLLMWLEALKDIILEISDYTEFDLDEKYREHKLDLLRGVRHYNEETVKRKRAAARLGIVEKPGLLGPDGQPLH